MLPLRYHHFPTKETIMTPADYTIEKTSSGMQYVIPGTEKLPAPKGRRFKADGDQLVIPGAERISNREHLLRLAAKPLSSRRGQRGLRGTGLFGG